MLLEPVPPRARHRSKDKEGPDTCFSLWSFCRSAPFGCVFYLVEFCPVWLETFLLPVTLPPRSLGCG